MTLFSKELEADIKAYLTRYETKRSAILPILHRIQDEFTYIDDKHVDYLFTEFGLDKIQVKEVISFYSMYLTEKPEKYRILFCDNIVCTICGAKETMAEIKNYMKKRPDLSISLEGVPCLGVCDGAPAMLINKDRFLKLNKDNVVSCLEQYIQKTS